MAQQKPYSLIPPGGPSGPFWGVMRQSGLIIATQIQERETAELLITVLNIIDGDFDTIRAVGKEFKALWDYSPDTGAEEYIIRQLGGALVNYTSTDKVDQPPAQVVGLKTLDMETD